MLSRSMLCSVTILGSRAYIQSCGLHVILCATSGDEQVSKDAANQVPVRTKDKTRGTWIIREAVQ